MRLWMPAALVWLALGPVAAQDYPTKPINIIVPAAAGGPTDTISRITAQAMSKLLGQQITIENIGGAGGTIGTTRAARAEPDGYTLLIYHVGLATAATLYRKLPYDTRTAFTSVGLLTNAPMTIVARSNYEPANLKELIAYLKKPAIKASMGNAGIGSASHLCGMLFMTEAKLQITTVPYRGTGPVMNDLIGKQIDLACDQATNTTGPIQSKQVKGYAVTTKVRLKSLPDLPTADEAGLKGFELGVWHGLFGPRGLPAPMVGRLSGALRAALKDPELIKRFSDINTDPMPDGQATPAAAEKMLLSEIDRWAPIINGSGQYAD